MRGRRNAAAQARRWKRVETIWCRMMAHEATKPTWALATLAGKQKIRLAVLHARWVRQVYRYMRPGERFVVRLGQNFWRFVAIPERRK